MQEWMAIYLTSSLENKHSLATNLSFLFILQFYLRLRKMFYLNQNCIINFVGFISIREMRLNLEINGLQPILFVVSMLNS